MNTCNRHQKKKKLSSEQTRRGSDDRLQYGTCTRTPVDRTIKVSKIKQVKITNLPRAEGLSKRVKAAHGTFLLVQCIEKRALLLKNKPSPQNSQRLKTQKVSK